MLDAAPEAFFLPAARGERFCLFHRHPAGSQARGSVLHVHAFGEEMNKSRRTCALAARAIANSGFAVLQIDLAGCGDSSDDFGDASWDDWILDVELGLAWLRENVSGETWLWGVRSASLLVSAVASKIPGETANLLAWQPVADGLTYLNQILRLRVAAERLTGSGSDVATLRNQLLSGESLEVAGYSLSSPMASGMAQARFAIPSPRSRVIWLEAAARAGAGMSPAAQTWVSKATQAGVNVYAEAVEAPAFWQTQEIEEGREFVRSTVQRLALA